MAGGGLQIVERLIDRGDEVREVRQQLESSGHFDRLSLAVKATATGLTALAARRRDLAASAIEPRVTAKMPIEH